MRISYHFALVTSAFLVTCLDGTSSSFAGQEPAEAPKTIEEGLSRLEELLGCYTEQDNRQWRFVYDDEVETTPEPGKPIVIVRKGIMTYGVPVRSGDMITFDVILSLQRSIYDGSKGGRRTLSREIQNHSVLRYYARPTLSGDWFYDAAFLSHSVPDFRDRPFERGRVNWLPNAIELVGTGIDEFFRQEGTLVTGAYLSRKTLSREGDRLVERTHTQTYELADNPDGDALPIPDFSKPFGDPFTSRLESEPMQGD